MVLDRFKGSVTLGAGDSWFFATTPKHVVRHIRGGAMIGYLVVVLVRMWWWDSITR